MNNKNFENSLLDYATFFVETKSTLRKTANHFKVSKSTLHNLFTKNLKLVSKNLFLSVRKLLDTNQKEKHLRGGFATKQKHLKTKKQ